VAVKMQEPFCFLLPVLHGHFTQLQYYTVQHHIYLSFSTPKDPNFDLRRCQMQEPASSHLISSSFSSLLQMASGRSESHVYEDRVRLSQPHVLQRGAVKLHAGTRPSHLVVFPALPSQGLYPNVDVEAFRPIWQEAVKCRNPSVCLLRRGPSTHRPHLFKYTVQRGSERGSISLVCMTSHTFVEDTESFPFTVPIPRLRGVLFVSFPSRQVATLM